MTEKLLINVSVEETRVALVESGRLENLEIDSRQLEEAKGNIYKARVHRVNASLQAAFVDYGAEKQGFLPLAEIHDRYFPNGQRDKKLSITEVLKNGQELMVQVVKDEIGNKGASLSTFVSLPGRYLVLMAQTDKTGISRRLPGDERSRLKRIIDNLDVPEGFGVIIRTAGVGRDEDELKADLDYLKRLWEALEQRYKELRRPDVIHQERSIAMRFLRDYATSSLDEIIVDDIDATEEIRDFCTILVPELRKKVTFYDDPTPLFSRYQIEDQIDDVFARRIDLPSGGYIIIDQTEAMVSVDVNSGRVKTDDIEKTALKTNLESAAEVARQLKIRDLGGLVVVDFIDMRERSNIKKVEQEAKDAFANDKAKVKFTRISDFGLMEISRQRLKTAITKGSFSKCNHCGGTGMLRSVESSSLYLLRRMKETVIRGNYLHAVGRAPVEIANYLANRKRRELMELEYQTKTTIEIRGLKECPPTMAYVELLTRPQRGKKPKRFIQEYDLVRSDVNKEELAPDDDFLVEAAHARGVHLSDDDWKDLYRRIEKQLATEADKRLERKEKEAAEAERKAQEAEKRAAEAAEQVVEAQETIAELEKKRGLMGWLKRMLVGGSNAGAAPAPVAEAPKVIEDKSSSDGDRRSGGGGRGGRGGRGGKPASERIRSRNHGPRSRPLKAKEVGDDDKGSSNQRSEGGGGNKRKRRGGRGGRGGGGGGQDDRQQQQQNRPPKSQGGQGGQGGGEQGDGDKPKRRRRRRRKRNDGEGLAGPGSEGGAPQEQSKGGGEGEAKKGSEGDTPKGEAPKKKTPAKKADGDARAEKPAAKKKAEGEPKGDKPAAKKKAEGDAKADKPADKKKAEGDAKAEKPANKQAAKKPAAKQGADDTSDKPAKKPAARKKPAAPKRPAAPKKPATAGQKKSDTPKAKAGDAKPKASKPAAKTDGGEKAPKAVPKKGGVIDLRGGSPAAKTAAKD